MFIFLCFLAVWAATPFPQTSLLVGSNGGNGGLQIGNTGATNGARASLLTAD